MSATIRARSSSNRRASSLCLAFFSAIFCLSAYTINTIKMKILNITKHNKVTGGRERIKLEEHFLLFLLLHLFEVLCFLVNLERNISHKALMKMLIFYIRPKFEEMSAQ